MSSFQGSDAPPSLEAANQAQIDDLVQRNRALEYMNDTLNKKLSAEANRSKEAVQDFQQRWHEKEKSLREECEDFLAYYRCVQLSTVSALESERMNVLNEQKALREEKLLQLQRDFRIVMFDVKERELEERVVELEEENERMVSERRELVLAFQKRFSLILARLRSQDVEIDNMSSEREVAEKDISKLNEKNAQLQTSLTSTYSKLEHVSLQLEGAQSSRFELEGINEDLKRKNYDLGRQIDQWKRLEHEGDAELDALRQRKSELEAKIEEMRDRLSREKEILTKNVEKEQKCVEQLEETVLTWKTKAEMHQRELEDAREDLAECQKELEKLKAVQVSDQVNQSKVRKVAVQSTKSSATVEKVKRDAPSLRRKKDTIFESETDEVIPPRPSRKQRKMSPVVKENEDSREVVNEKEKEVEVTKPKPRPKLRTKEEKSMLLSAPSPATTSQRRWRISADDSDEESDIPDRKIAKITTKPGRSRMTASKKLSKTSEEPVAIAADSLPKTKKRKINIFAGAGTQSNKLKFDFSSGAEGLSIPTSLTPIKEAEGPVPNRTVSGVTSGLGITGLLRGRMGGTR